MRDESASPNPVQSKSGDGDIIMEMKKCFIRDRSEDSAVDSLEKLLALQVENIDMDAWLEVKDFLASLIETITVPNLVSRHQIIMLNAINNSPSIVVDFLADLIAQNIDVLESELATSHVAVSIAFARRVVDCHCSESIAKFLWRFAHIKAVQNELASLLTNADAETRFRVHQVAANYLKENGNGEGVSHLIHCLIKEINAPDILTQLTAIETLSEAAYNNKSATAYLFSLGLIDDMYSLLNKISEQPDAGFLFPAVMKFFGHLSITDASCLDQYPNFLRSLLDLVYQYDRLDASLRLLAFDTFAVVASTNDAKRYLDSNSEYDLEKALNMFGVSIAMGPLELRVRHIEALSVLFHNEEEIPKDDINAITQKWWTYLGEGFPAVIVIYMSRPFDNLRLATLQLLMNILSYGWAIEALKNARGFVDAILDRQAETTPQGKHLKYNIVRLIIKKGSQHFDSSTMMRFKLYSREGPFHVEVPPTMDMMNI